MRASSLLPFVAAGSMVAAQQTPAQLAAQIPDCVLPCDTKGFAAVGCTDADYACHCAHSDALKTVVGGCLANSTCSGEELNTFGGLVASICQNLNVTSNGTATATATGSRPTGSIVPVSQGINRWGIECGLAPIVGVVAVVSGLAWVL